MESSCLHPSPNTGSYIPDRCACRFRKFPTSSSSREHSPDAARATGIRAVRIFRAPQVLLPARPCTATLARRIECGPPCAVVIASERELQNELHGARIGLHVGD